MKEEERRLEEEKRKKEEEERRKKEESRAKLAAKAKMFEGLYGDQAQASSSPAVKKPSVGGPATGSKPALVPTGGSSVGNLAAILQAQLPGHQTPSPAPVSPVAYPVAQEPVVAQVPSSPYGIPSGPPPTPVPPPPVPSQPRCQALHAYEPRSATELGFQPGTAVPSLVSKTPR
jgi:hypothetical protein